MKMQAVCKVSQARFAQSCRAKTFNTGSHGDEQGLLNSGTGTATGVRFAPAFVSSMAPAFVRRDISDLLRQGKGGALRAQ
jgi:hypothetical protein